jgi:hypothetical protein
MSLACGQQESNPADQSSTWRKVIGFGPEGVNAADRSRRGRRYAASSAVSSVEDC